MRAMQVSGWKRFYATSVGKKQIVGITGLAISGFVLTHVAGNMLLLCSAHAYNAYSHKLVTNPLLPVAELGLVLFFVLHVRQNRAARTSRYYQLPNSDGKGSSLAVRTAILSGLVLLAFLILHLITFKWGTHYSVTYDGVEMRDIYKLVAEKFHEPGYVAWYIFCLLLLGMHLKSGIAALFQSLGITTVRNCTVKKIAWGFAVLVTAGFISQPLYFILGGGN
jgi:succinate dehydrogenase / fumarate reductase cytochrome b subunit